VQNALGQLEADPEAVAALAAVERLDAVDFASAAVVVEAAPERLKLKRAIFAGLDRLVPLTFGMDPVHGLSFLGGARCGAIFGGAISSILISVPGTPAAVATMLDGYELTKQGRPGSRLAARSPPRSSAGRSACWRRWWRCCRCSARSRTGPCSPMSG
jgi:hypothetical protein